MDLEGFRKAVDRFASEGGHVRKAAVDLAREEVKVARAIAPAYQTAAVAAAGVYAPWAAPFLAVLPADVVFAGGAAQLTMGQSLFVLAPELREERKGVEVDYAKLGELAAMEAIKRGA